MSVLPSLSLPSQPSRIIKHMCANLQPADARALYSSHGLTSRKATFDVMTSYYGGAYQATLILYPDMTESTCWTPLIDGLRCKNLCAAMKHLWSAVQEALGAMIGKRSYGLECG